MLQNYSSDPGTITGITAKAPGKMTVKTYNRILEINKETWNSIIKPDHIICRYEYIQAMENAGINDCDYRYIMIYDGEKLIAHTYIYAMSFDLDMFDRGFSKKIIQFVRNHFHSSFLRFKVIECGTPTALGNTITTVDGYDRVNIINLVYEKMLEYAREKNHKILILRDFYHEDMYYSDALKPLGFKRQRILPNMQLINNWTTFDDYLNDMRSRYRYRIKKFFRSLEKSAVQIEVRDHFSDLAEELTALWFHIYDHAKEYKREILTPQYFINMDHYLKERSKVVLFKLDNKIIAFDFVIIDDYTLRPLFIGLDYKYNEQNKLYFNILCQSVKMGIELGKKSIEMGITTISPKKEIGGEVIPTFGYMKHISPIPNIIISNLFSLFAPPIYRERKHVFNRRYYERIYANLQLTLKYNHRTITVTTRNISETGIRIVSPVPLRKSGNKIFLLGFKTDQEKNSYTLTGKIVWTRKIDDQYMAGIQFVELHQSTKEKLHHLVEYLKAKEANG